MTTFLSNAYHSSSLPFSSHSLCIFNHKNALLWPCRLCITSSVGTLYSLDTHTASSFPSLPLGLCSSATSEGLLPQTTHISIILAISPSVWLIFLLIILTIWHLFVGNLFTITLSPSGGEASWEEGSFSVFYSLYISRDLGWGPA